MFIAVIMRANGDESLRKRGDWASFVHPKRDSAIRQAIDAKDEWETKYDVEYIIKVGKLTHNVVDFTDYITEKL